MMGIPFVLLATTVFAVQGLETVTYDQLLDPYVSVRILRRGLVKDGIVAISNFGSTCDQNCLKKGSLDELIGRRLVDVASGDAKFKSIVKSTQASMGFATGTGREKSKGLFSLLIPASDSSKINLGDNVESTLLEGSTILLAIGQDFDAVLNDHSQTPLNVAVFGVQNRWYEKRYTSQDTLDMSMPVGGDFCNGMPMSMFMDGFTWPGDRDKNCLTLIFPSIVLNSAMKYSVGVLFCFLFGFFVELQLKVRRTLVKRPMAERRYTLVRSVLYAAQIVSGYFMMLLAMTYSTPIFVSSMLGLVVGHIVFNLDQPIPEFSDPCCQTLLDEENDVFFQ